MTENPGHLVHTWDFTIRGLIKFFYNGFYGYILYESTIMVIKPLILLEWIHIFISAARPLKPFQWLCYILGTFNVLTCLLAILIDATSCKPQEYWLNGTTKGGHCVNTTDVAVVLAALNLITDMCILLLPQSIIWRLQLSRAKRAGVSLVFSIGILSMLTAAYRIYLTCRFTASRDIAYIFSEAGVFGLFEMTTAILVLTAPSVPKPIHHLAGKAASSLNRLLGADILSRIQNSYKWSHRLNKNGDPMSASKVTLAKNERVSSV
ncbi:hypothetical protein PFICI_03588 [Pestalotiopsis fici W106-1]|uniref:Rhodopsin domain-containing protein n=1 Tax=Pestalotiopsis fici (strain W106-1 / CGMCC3.15140) TaxID=1229662 RepID=W3XHK7_PESFW|nr:uncharacterized protein PFICI_03588 [Pestalotiopsis fici W106-1]ETS85563.1 hypothetical protein PFICI_03588 [Pestalotiopsis fici W106-1]